MGRPVDKIFFTTGQPGDLIKAHANVVGDGNVRNAHIDRQTKTREYVMTTVGGTSRCKLVASNSPDEGQAYMIVTDKRGSTYYVTKLTAHRATVMRLSDGGTGFDHVDGSSAPWVIGTPPDHTYVQLETW